MTSKFSGLVVCLMGASAQAGGKRYSPSQISGFILAKMKETAGAHATSIAHLAGMSSIALLLPNALIEVNLVLQSRTLADRCRRLSSQCQVRHVSASGSCFCKASFLWLVICRWYLLETHLIPCK